ncbi:MAG TPA: GDSL-type esterase/lipase family protein [Candidatus Limnocylindrales bacterium]|nr:GDSL-type esterase/lipase family protein [Candidatus Limnocylindrales bacterium]
MASRRRLALFALAAAALATLVCLLAVELVLRFADHPPTSFSPWIRSERLGFRLAPNIDMPMTTPEYSVRIVTNSLGFRDEEPAADPQRDRILALGDSFTMGYGVERGSIFTDLLEKNLGADVVNTGTGGYEIVHQVQVVEEYGRKLAPDAVVYVLYLGNDLAQNDEWQRSGDGTSLTSLVRQYPTRQPRQIKLLQLARNLRYGMRMRHGEERGEWLPFEGYLALCARELTPAARADYDLSAALLAELRDRVAALDAPLLVVLLPYRSMVEPQARESLKAKVPDLDSAYDLTRPAREIGERLRALGIDFLDATPALDQAHRSSGAALYFAVDGHLNEAGHRVLADLLRAPLAERLSRKPDL